MIRAILSALNEDVTSYTVTVMVNGVIISGEYICDVDTRLKRMKDWLQNQQGDETTRTVMNGAVEGFEQLIQQRALNQDNERQEKSEEDESENSKQSKSESFLLFNARILVNGQWIPDQSTVLEIKSSSVDMWTLGAWSA